MTPQKIKNPPGITEVLAKPRAATYFSRPAAAYPGPSTLIQRA